MELKPGYQQTEVGVIPEDWEINNLENVCVPKGLVRGPFGGALKKEYFVRNGFKVFEQKNAIYGDFNLGDYFIDAQKFSELKRFELLPGDFIVSCSGTIGKIFLVPEIAPRGVINQALLKISTDDNKITKQFFLHYFKWEKFQERIIDSTQGGAMKNLVGMSIFKKTKIPLPPTKVEQTAIANALSDADALIQSLATLIAKKRQIKQGAMQTLLNPYENGRLKTGWVVKTIEDMCVPEGLIRGPFGGALKKECFVANGFKVYEQRNAIYRDAEIGSYFIDQKKYQELKRFSVKPGDFVISCSGTIGKIYQIPAGAPPGVINQALLKLTIDTEKFSEKYFYHYFSWNLFQEKIIDSTQGGAMKNLVGMSKFRITEMLIPEKLNEQTHIATILSDMDTEIAALEAKLAKYRHIKQGMMQNLLTGRIRLVQPDSNSGAVA